MSGVAGRTVVLAGATSAAGLAVGRALREAGARVIGVGRDRGKLDILAEAVPGLVTEQCDLTDEADVRTLAARIIDAEPAIDGIVHLVGGWRGGGGLAGQSDEDYRFLERSLTALRHVSRAFDGALRSSDAGRLAIVSSTAVARPLAGGANYAAVKAASEAWAHAVAHGFAKDARDRGAPLQAASVIFRVESLDPVTERLAQAIVELWDAETADLNDSVRELA
ncbi:SDR family NAD(P)-dependent oxidoreductase [Microbacterium aureliae]